MAKEAVAQIRLYVPAGQANPAPPYQDTQKALEQSSQQVASLEQQVAAANTRLKQAEHAIWGLEKELEAEQTARKQISEEKNTLSRQLVAAQTELDSNRNKGASASTDAAQQSAWTNALETQVGHGGCNHAITGEPVLGLEETRGSKKHAVAIHNFSGFANEESAVGVTVESHTETRLLGDDAFLQTLQVQRTASGVDVPAIG